MGDVLLLNLVFFFPAAAGAIGFAVLVYRVVLRSETAPGADAGGTAGPEDLARSA